MRLTNRYRILVWILGLLVVLLIPSEAAAARFPLSGWWDEVDSAPSAPSGGDLTGQLANELNNARAQNGLQPLTRSASLDQIAAARSQDMVNRNYFSHTTPSGTTVLKSLRGRGIGFSKAGEVITRNTYSDRQSATTAAQALLNSPEHRVIVLDPNYIEFGVGEGTDGNGMHVFTAVYVQR